MRKITSLLFIALLALTSIGCDSEKDEEDDAAKFVGLWALTGVTDASGNAMETFASTFDAITLLNKDDANFTLTVDPKVGDNTVLNGTYTVTQSGKQFKLVATTPLGPATLVFAYAFDGDNKVVLTPDSGTVALLNLMFEGVSLEGAVTITVTRQT